MKVQVVFKGGGQVIFEADEFTTTKNALGEFTKFEWKTPGDWTAKLHSINLAEIVAVVALREREEPDHG
jgi:hypothetical protein